MLGAVATVVHGMIREARLTNYLNVTAPVSGSVHDQQLSFSVFW